MSDKSNNPYDPDKRSLHSASQFGKPSRAPFPEPGKEERDDAMSALMERLKQLNDETIKRSD
ncbi:hypothetical protein DDZ13_06780 [Coraliomargarita sinensis]|uniref:Uncharacterized protein n=1 Tax=Coraliomargarita sinensis TaxID=2174842 RepID=A0A317ZJX4_9BACT|nr:hypothetical protein [Coraliomargarita sinensis]PXA04238.1 hypothetical protein DDZ13_06780 [Coraliomargarita sinensis]